MNIKVKTQKIFEQARNYHQGNGVKINNKKAVELLEQASELGHKGAMYNLAVLYLNGDHGINKAPEKALPLFQILVIQMLYFLLV